MGHSSVPCLSQEHPPALKLLPQALAVLTDPILLAPSFPPASEIPLGAENQERNLLRNHSESACPSLLEELGVRSARCCEMRRGKPFAFRFLGGSEASPGAVWARRFQLLLGFAAQLWDGCDGEAEVAAAHSPGSCPLCTQNLGELRVQKCSGGVLEKTPESGTSPGQKCHHHLPLQPFALVPGWGTSVVPAQCRGAGPGCGVGERPHRKPQHGHVWDGQGSCPPAQPGCPGVVSCLLGHCGCL